jgi:glutaredoxin
MAAVSDLQTVILYSRPGCGRCDEARTLLTGLLERRRAAGLPSPTIEERDIDSDPAWQRAYFTTIPVVELGEERLELVTSATALRRFLDDQLDR